MKKVRLEVEETLSYRREIDVLVNDDMDEDELENILSKSERSAESLDEFIWNLRDYGVTCDGYDDSLDSPDSVEIECDQYDFIDEDEG